MSDKTALVAMNSGNRYEVRNYQGHSVDEDGYLTVSDGTGEVLLCAPVTWEAIFVGGAPK